MHPGMTLSLRELARMIILKYDEGLSLVHNSSRME